ncbi:DUF2167 domain-containing protein [Paenibacillus roseipurpureus]|uniref:DUF2167 domain-containing protein n=1 Tax=Paenibacillus roseopurpureus TaxID=2918901 RepID=A0AA96RH50_9BACL|nr:DUF2167 domain-containing protein [Paenibacillus sp. MBLB1832]WNR42933.1 DUF2167 domain-containing protein [Paenibacillus sp. MBLB1832]
MLKRIFVLSLILIFVLPWIVIAAETPAPTTPKVNWIKGGVVVDLGSTSTLDLGKEFVFLNGEDTKTIMKSYQDIPSGNEIGSVYPVDPNQKWALYLEYTESGHIKDDEKTKIDANNLLDSYRKGTENQNSHLPIDRQLEVTGWDVKPFYDEKLHSLTWSLAAREKQSGHELVNYDERILTRTGYISAILVTDPTHRNQDQQLVASGVLPKITQKTGQRYEDFNPSTDKVSKFGLTALILGGVGLAVAKKVGLLAVILLIFKKFWILILAILGGGWRWLKWKLFRKKEINASHETMIQTQHNDINQ